MGRTTDHEVTQAGANGHSSTRLSETVNKSKSGTKVVHDANFNNIKNP
jgi:hypothetical protein